MLGNAQAVVGRYTPEGDRLARAGDLFAFARTQLYGASDEDFRITWARTLIGAAQEPDRVSELLKLVDDGSGIEGFEFDQDMRWTLVTKARGYDLAGAAARLDAELERDGTDRGQRAAETVRASQPAAAVKAAAWERFHTDRESSMHMLRAAMQGFFWTHQHDLVAPYTDRYFDQVRGVFAERTKDYASAYLHALGPTYRPSEEIVARTQALIDSLDADELLLERGLREMQDEMQRTLACRTYAES